MNLVNEKLYAAGIAMEWWVFIQNEVRPLEMYEVKTSNSYKRRIFCWKCMRCCAAPHTKGVQIRGNVWGISYKRPSLEGKCMRNPELSHTKSFCLKENVWGTPKKLIHFSLFSNKCMKRPIISIPRKYKSLYYSPDLYIAEGFVLTVHCNDEVFGRVSIIRII